jgi:hypothetical protein
MPLDRVSFKQICVGARLFDGPARPRAAAEGCPATTPSAATPFHFCAPRIVVRFVQSPLGVRACTKSGVVRATGHIGKRRHLVASAEG